MRAHTHTSISLSKTQLPYFRNVNTAGLKKMGTVPFLEGTNCSEQGQMQQRNQALTLLLMFQASGTRSSDAVSA